MKKILKYVLFGLCGTLIVTCMACSFIAGKNMRKVLKCERLEVCIKDSLQNRFVSENDVKRFLDREYGTYIGMPLDSLDLVKMENIIDGRSAVMKSHEVLS